MRSSHGSGCHRLDHRRRQKNRKRAALSRAAFDADAAALELHDLLGQGEPKPGASVATRGARIELLELDEQLFEVIRADADPGVANSQAQIPVAVLIGADMHLAAFIREL